LIYSRIWLALSSPHNDNAAPEPVVMALVQLTQSLLRCARNLLFGMVEQPKNVASVRDAPSKKPIGAKACCPHSVESTRYVAHMRSSATFKEPLRTAMCIDDLGGKLGETLRPQSSGLVVFASSCLATG
jgi:hypothetical protein